MHAGQLVQVRIVITLYQVGRTSNYYLVYTGMKFTNTRTICRHCSGHEGQRAAVMMRQSESSFMKYSDQ